MEINASDKLRQARGNGRRDDYDDNDEDDGARTLRVAPKDGFKKREEELIAKSAAIRTNGHLAE